MSRATHLIRFAWFVFFSWSPLLMNYFVAHNIEFISFSVCTRNRAKHVRHYDMIWYDRLWMRIQWQLGLHIFWEKKVFFFWWKIHVLELSMTKSFEWNYLLLNQWDKEKWKKAHQLKELISVSVDNIRVKTRMFRMRSKILGKKSFSTFCRTDLSEKEFVQLIPNTLKIHFNLGIWASMKFQSPKFPQIRHSSPSMAF